MKSYIAAIFSSAHNYIIGVPIAILLVMTAYLAIIWMAISKKDEVEASAWHRDAGFFIKARNNRAPTQRRPKAHR